MDKSAKQDKVPLTERKQYVYMMPIYGMEVTRLTSGGLTDVFMWKKKNRHTANNCCEKSAEAIVDGSNELAKEKKNVRSLTIY